MSELAKIFDMSDSPWAGTVISRKPTHIQCTFPNGWQISVISDGYGREDGLYEAAVVDKHGHLCYDTPITNDVLGWLTAEDVFDVAKQISELPPEEESK